MWESPNTRGGMVRIWFEKAGRLAADASASLRAGSAVACWRDLDPPQAGPAPLLSMADGARCGSPPRWHHMSSDATQSKCSMAGARALDPPDAPEDRTEGGWNVTMSLGERRLSMRCVKTRSGYAPRSTVVRCSCAPARQSLRRRLSRASGSVTRARSGRLRPRMRMAMGQARQGRPSCVGSSASSRRSAAALRYRSMADVSGVSIAPIISSRSLIGMGLRTQASSLADA